MNAHVHGTSIQSSETVLRAAELFRESRNDYTEMRYGSVSCGTIIMSRGIVPRAAERLYRATERLYKAAEQYKKPRNEYTKPRNEAAYTFPRLCIVVPRL